MSYRCALFGINFCLVSRGLYAWKVCFCNLMARETTTCKLKANLPDLQRLTLIYPDLSLDRFALVYWPEEKSVSVVTAKSIVSPDNPAIGCVCKVHTGKLAATGKSPIVDLIHSNYITCKYMCL